MLAGFNVLLTGLGSKFHLLEEFRRVALQGERCGTVMGFKSSCSLGELAEMLCGRAFGVNTDGMRVDGMDGLGAACRRRWRRRFATRVGRRSICSWWSTVWTDRELGRRDWWSF